MKIYFKNHQKLSRVILYGFLIVVSTLLIRTKIGLDLKGKSLDYQQSITKVIKASKYEYGPPDPEEMLELVNQERARVGVAPLVIDERLSMSAQMKADDMDSNNYFDHIDANNKHGYEYVFDMTGLDCSYAGENIYKYAHGTSQRAFNWWKNSKPHYEAMKNPKYTHTGFGVAGPENKTVQHFCVAK